MREGRGASPLRYLLAVLAIAIGVLGGGGAAAAAGSEGSPTIVFGIPVQAVHGDTPVAYAGLFDSTTFEPIAGQILVFTPSQYPPCFAITDANGIASCPLPTVQFPAGTYRLAIDYAGDSIHAPSSTDTTLEIAYGEARLTITGPVGPVTVGTTVLASVVAESLSAPGGPLAGRLVFLSIRERSCWAYTDATGLATCALPDVPYPAGPTTINATFIDGFFYRNTEASAPVMVVAPSSPVSFTTTPPAVSTVQTAPFAWSSSVPFSRFECSLDGAAFAACSSPRTYHGLAAGPHELCVRITTDPAAACWAWTIVSPGAPETLFTLTPPPVTSSRTAAFAWTSDQPAPRFQCSLDGAAFAPCSSPRTYRGLALGTHELRVRAVNFAGDVDPTPAQFTWTITA